MTMVEQRSSPARQFLEILFANKPDELLILIWRVSVEGGSKPEQGAKVAIGG